MKIIIGMPLIKWFWKFQAPNPLTIPTIQNMKLFIVGLSLLYCAAGCNCQSIECFVNVSSEGGVSISQEVVQNINTTLRNEIDLSDLQTSAQSVRYILAEYLNQTSSLRDVGAVVVQLLETVLTYQDEAAGDLIDFVNDTLSMFTTICVDGEPLQPQQFLEEIFQELNIDSLLDPEPAVEFITEAVTRVWQQITQSNITQGFLDSFRGIVSGIQTRNDSFVSMERFGEIATGIVQGTVGAFQNLTEDFDAEKIDKQIQETINATGDFFETVGDGFSEFVENIGNWFSNTFRFISTP
eukprot:TRINITY_DN6484_c0_g1_i2.p1 TRINITY_DN6484_c0_g1~~TRINITY_DN6484_c0_g1_i2.p1  ORF type:complete len:296 (+),score=32.17 TRINITY_DN6484_c0_g1_i2:317-1204(+)